MSTCNNIILLISHIECFNDTARGSTQPAPIGHVSLQCPGNPSLPSTAGYVTVYQPAIEQHVPVCQSGFNRAAAAAVCRQIGYVDAAPVFSGSYFGNPSELK